MTPNQPIPADPCQNAEILIGNEEHTELIFSKEAQIIDPAGGTKDLVPKGLRVRVPSRAPLFEVQRGSRITRTVLFRPITWNDGLPSAVTLGNSNTMTP
jgi:hypothetical protein